ncbi:hypothetical protein CRUP_022777, partial [Coryphaenoides rupestris]
MQVRRTSAVTSRTGFAVWSSLPARCQDGPGDPAVPESNTTTPTTNQVAAAYFLSLEPIRGQGSAAELSSPIFLPSLTCQVSFYHYTETREGELQVLARDQLSGRTTSLWSASASREPWQPTPVWEPWQRTLVQVTSDQQFQ